MAADGRIFSGVPWRSSKEDSGPLQDFILLQTTLGLWKSSLSKVADQTSNSIFLYLSVSNLYEFCVY